MVIVLKGGQAIDISHVYYIQALTSADSGPVLIGASYSPLATLLSLQKSNHCELRLLADRPGNGRDVVRITSALRPHHIRSGWYAPSPEVLAYVDGRADVPAEAVRTGGRRLTPATALDVFRACHETSLTARVIGARYGISAVSVGKIKRGEVYRGLFRREAAADVPGGAPGYAGRGYYVSEAREGAPRYRMTQGKRGVK